MKYIKLFEQWILNEKKGDTYEAGCVMLYFDFPEMKEIQNRISADDLYTEEGDRSFGFENEPHVTILYGIHSDEVQDNAVMDIASKTPFSSLTLYKISAFKNEKFDVLKFDVDGNGLREANRNLTENVPYSSSFPDYVPHCTIAYLKPGTAQKYIDAMSDVKHNVMPTELVYSKPSGEKITKSVVIQ